jgi:protein crumbs
VNNGTCSDKIGDFDCTCPKNFGAKTCDVELIGCKDTPCTQFARECVPRYDEGIHSFFCDCPEGFAGERCEMNTTMSFNGTGPVVIERPSESGSYELSFRFKTTLPDVALAVGSGGTYFSLTLKGGKLNLRSSLLNNLDGIYSGSSLSDADWHKVWISINTSHIALAAGSEQTIHPVVDIHDVEREKDKDQGFNMTFLGGFTSGTNFLNNDRVPSFSGCIQDIKINSEKIILEHNLLNATTVTKGCPRTNQCNPNPCINGKCTDLWHNFTCECERPYLGDRCQYGKIL